jgi:hypothetical protein
MMWRGRRYRMPANDFAIPRMEPGKQRAIQSMEEARDWERRFIGEIKAGRDPRGGPARSARISTELNDVSTWVAVDRRAGIPRVDFAPVRIVRISGEALTSGVDPHNIENVPVRITSPARTVVDCFKFRNKIGIDVAVEALREYRRLRKGTADELWRQAARLRMTKVMRPYWDAMSS